MTLTFALPLEGGKGEWKASLKSLKKTDGIKKLRLNRRKKRLCVTFDEARLSPSEVERAVADAGIDAQPIIGGSADRFGAFAQLMCWVLTLSMLYLTLASRVILPVPEVFSYPLSAGVTELVLMLAVWLLSFRALNLNRLGGRYAGWDTYAFATLAAVCAAAYSVPALIYCAWKISAGADVNVELFFDSAALLPTLATLGIATQKRATRRTENTLRELGLPVENLRFLSADETKKAVFAARLSKIFTWVALLTALGALVCWIVRDQRLPFAVKCAVCVLVVSCPNIPRRMAPTLITRGVAACAENKTPVSNAPVLEKLKETDTVIFESHDALTRSEAIVRGCVLTDGMSQNMLLALAASALQMENDGVSIAIREKAEALRLPLDPLIERDVNEDSDVRALVGETRVLVGSYDFLLKNALDLSKWEQQVDELTNEGLICVMVASSGMIKGIITLESKLLPRVCETMDKLRKMKIETYVMATENTKAARVLALQVGADKSVFPHEAEIAIRLLAADKRKTLYVYGGESPVFDVPGLKMNLGANPGAQAEVRGELGDLPNVLSIARRTFGSVKKRLRLWLLYELITLPVAAGALRLWLGVTISPLLAAPLMLMMNILMLYTGKTHKRI